MTSRLDAHTARAALAQTAASTPLPTWTSFLAVPGRRWEVLLLGNGPWGLLTSGPGSRPSRKRRQGEKRLPGRGVPRAGVRSGSWGGCSPTSPAPHS